MNENFAGKAFIVTGAGSGIGRATALRLSREGGRVVVGDLDADSARRVAAEIADAGGTAHPLTIDVRLESDADALVQCALEEFGRLDGAVNNAGAAHVGARLHEIATENWRHVTGVVLDGVFFGMRAQLRHFCSLRAGVIVNVSSLAGYKAGYGQGSYVAAKHGVIGLTRQAGLEYIRDGIRVNAVAPGLVDTPIVGVLTDDMKATIQPGGKAGRPEQIANAIVWLLSDEASFVAGETMLVDAAALQK
ncbi:short chain dehydrogenase (plasmid) [Mycolicibacterium arabiense]|uniref:Short chain dehydrogenase n=1 Tax=Mycolicibacterium arabiense TaxID=1286181 RepID=A0A7I7RQ91_9MYCO|nr:SDR family NAD(P)-dependent oxidoreductase [Mycolicibacterium arabiense]MCV7371982.1 SDR family oxidoreductase [Mycolicibacterium arabiense]BBY46697.1 short chain dehydrogenase [Mycolicibacterium arabiense]